MTRARGSSNSSAIPHIFSVWGSTPDGVDHDDGGVGGHERGAGVVHKHVEAGGVEDIDLGLFHSMAASAVEMVSLR